MQLQELTATLKTFNKERDWDQYHNPKDLLIALMSEVGELADLYRWLSPEDIKQLEQDPEKKKAVEEELADIFMYLLTLCYVTNTDIEQAVLQKLEKNKKKYPVDKIKGIHSNKLMGVKGT
jgi:NTP pyrophosphatase (non-canonical NTP hydrolase)